MFFGIISGKKYLIKNIGEGFEAYPEVSSFNSGPDKNTEMISEIPSCPFPVRLFDT